MWRTAQRVHRVQPNVGRAPDRLVPEAAGRRKGATMDASRGEDRRSATEPDADVSLHVRTAMADAAFVSEGIALGLPLKWIERAPLSEDRPRLVRAWSAQDRGVPLPDDR